MTKKILACVLAAALIFSLCACGDTPSGDTTPLKDITNEETADTSSAVTADTAAMDFSFTDREKDASFGSGTQVTLSADGAKITGSGAEWTDGHLKISAEGTYILSGKTESYIEVSVGDTEKVQIVLSGAQVENKEGPALYIASGDKVFLTVKDGTENTLSDGESYTFSADDGLDAAVFSRADLCINGGGTLNINGNQKHAVVSKDDLVITGCSLNVTAKNVGLDGKDCLKVCNASLNITAGSDGMRASNAEESDRGYIYIADGTVNIESENDGMQAETVLRIDGGKINITAGGGSENASYSEQGGWNDRWMMPNGSSESTDTTESAKGLKAAAEIMISGGSFTLDTADDTVHSNGDIAISGGSFTLSSGDDGMHADSALSISGGEITLKKSYEGLEGSEITVSGGTLDLTASDDGLNAAGGNDSSAMGGRPGMGHFESSSGSILISGGYLLIDASGDGVDSNGSLTVTGGVTLVSGPENSGNGALDYASEAKITGGVFIATGTAGMATGFTSAENQGAILTNISAQSGKTAIAICDGDKVLASFTPEKSYSSVVLSAPGIEEGGSYSLIVGGSAQSADQNGFADSGKISGGETVLEIEMASLIYGSSGGMGGGMGGPMGGGHGGMGGGRGF